MKNYFITALLLLYLGSTYAHNTQNKNNSLLSENIYVDKDVTDIEIPATNDVGVFQLISHGRQGELLLDGIWMKSGEIAEFLLPKINPAITHLNIYGCEFAKGYQGYAAVKELERMLHIAIAASTNITGKNGDWILETGNATAVLNLTEYNGNLQCTSPSVFTLTSDMMGGTSTYSTSSNVILPADFPKNKTNVNGISGFNIRIAKSGNYSTTSAEPTPMMRGDLFNNFIDPDEITSSSNNFNRYIFTFTGTVKPTSIKIQSWINNLFSTTAGARQLNEQIKVSITRQDLTGTATANGVQLFGCPAGYTDPITITSGLGSTPFINFVQPLNLSPTNDFFNACGFEGTLTDNKGIASLTVEYSNPFFASTGSGNYQPFRLEFSVCPLIGLPATGLTITAKSGQSGTSLNWSTLSEISTSHFVVEKSIDGRQFLPIGTPISAAGNSSSTKYYSAVDASFNPSIVYYRIALHDIDGKISYSNVFMLNENRRNSIVSVFPNPAAGEFKVKLDKQGEYAITVMDTRGAVITKKEIFSPVAGYTLLLSSETWVKGIYIVEVVDKKTKEKMIEKLVVK